MGPDPAHLLVLWQETCRCHRGTDLKSAGGGAGGLTTARLRLGWLLGRRFMLITHMGRRSGKIRRTCVMVLRFDARSGEAFVVAGSPRADWYQNIHASPAVAVAVGARRYRPAQRFITAEEIERVLAWSRDHQRFHARVQSLFFGWPWPPSDEDLRRLSRSLGGVAFRPAVTAQAADEGRPRAA